MTMEERIQKVLSRRGIASRRKIEEMILEGRIIVNGATATIGMKVDPLRDFIRVDGKLVEGAGRETAKLYFLFNKPKNVVTTLSDPEGRPSVGDYLKRMKHRIFPVGRLDFDSEGILLLTNDGDFANAVLHPSQRIPKTYMVKVKEIIEDRNIEKLRRGIILEDGKTLPARVKRVRQTEQNSWVEITIHEGRNRQVRRMLEKVGHPVLKLKRIAVNGIKLGSLGPGEMRPLTQEELLRMKKEIGL